jgi:hypothetical protein
MRNAASSFVVLFAGWIGLAACGSSTPAPPPGDNGSAGSAATGGGGSGATGGTGGSAGEPRAGSAGAPDAGTPDVDPGLETGPGPKPYPPGPYGVDVGAVIYNYDWLGWINPKAVNYTGNLEHIQLADFYDPDGKKTKAIFINASAYWCTVCKEENRTTIPKQFAIWKPKGVVFMETLFEDDKNPPNPADIQALKDWSQGIYPRPNGTKHWAADWGMLLDPGNKLSPFFDATATPMNMVIDAKTMKVMSVVTGLPEETWWQEQLGPLTK